MSRLRDNLPIRRWGLALAWLVVCVLASSELYASIQTSKSLELSVHELETGLEELADNQAASPAAKPIKREDSAPLLPPSRGEQAPEHSKFALNSGPAGNSTSSTSTGISVGSAPVAVLTTPAAIATDASLAERYTAERGLFLPDAPGLELLRPPQVSL